MSYKHLNYQERTLIKDWLNKGLSYREIGRRLNRSHTSISREYKRNLWCGEHYYLRSAQEFYETRMKRRAQRLRLKTSKIRSFVTDKLNQGWSPEIISGRLREFHSDDFVCHESIYQFIYIEAPELSQTLARKHVHRRKKYPYRKPNERIKNRIPLSLRPDDANSREAIGHWESDTIVGGDRKSGLNVIVERKTRLTNMSFMPQKSAEHTKKSIIRRLSNHPEHLVNSITYDNGSENVLHQEINDKLHVQSYFCEPYHSGKKALSNR